MNEHNTIETNQISFREFMFKYKRNKITLIVGVIAIVIQFGIFKYFYPFASFIHGDSFSYIRGAYFNMDVNTYMIGYSKFLRLFSVFSKSDFALTALQYLLIQFSALFLLFTVFYFYKPIRITQSVLLIIFIFNPLSLHLANLVSSDCLFAMLSFTWSSLLLWIIHKPTTRIVVWHMVVLFVAFTVRYNALIYPFISAFAIGLSKLPTRTKIAGVGVGILLCGSFVLFTSYQYKQLTGHWQYSPFSGWQMANNAMYAYRYVDKRDRKPVPLKYQKLDNMIRTFFDSTRNTKKFKTEAIKASTYYMWSYSMPLMKYRNILFKNDSSTKELKRWASMGPLYKSYGLYIIKQYPLYFLQYFIWPNAMKYYAPPVEFLQTYNSGEKGVNIETKLWFGYKTELLKTRWKDQNVVILNFYPILSGIINITMLFLLCFYISLKGWSVNKQFHQGLLMGGLFWLCNAFFTISASSAALRFQSFPIILTTVFVSLLIDWLFQLMKTMNKQSITREKLTIQEGVPTPSI